MIAGTCATPGITVANEKLCASIVCSDYHIKTQKISIHPTLGVQLII